MSETYVVTIQVPEGQLEDHEGADKNFARIEVRLPSGERVTDTRCRVQIELSRDAMLGFGKGLIRAAFGERRIWEMSASDHSSAVEALGIYLHPSSCQLLILEEDTGKLDEALRKPQDGT